MDTFSIYANRTSVLEQEVQIALLALSPHILRSEHRVQTRHSNRKSALIATLLGLATAGTCRSDRTRRPDAPAFPSGIGQDIFC